MPHFGAESKRQLATCHPLLQDLLNEAIGYFDFSVLEGHRNKADQNAAYARGASKVKWPYGQHNKLPSHAVDLAPYPIDWGNTKAKAEAARQRFVLLAGFILMLAALRGIKLRWGGDWDGDQDTRDERFRDLGHFELINPPAPPPVILPPPEG